MKATIDNLRNICLIGHGSCGKTMLTEAMLFKAKAIDRLGKPDDGTTTMDYDSEEIKRQISINTSMAPLTWKNCKINILDTPGFFDFIGDVKGALQVTDNAVLVVCAVSGVEVGTEKMWDYSKNMNIPRMVFINKMDRENANYSNAVDGLREKFGNIVIPVQIPIGAADNFKGIVDVIRAKAFYFTGDRTEERPVPSEYSKNLENYRQLIIDAAAETNDELLTKYLEGGELNEAEVMEGFKSGILAGKIIPVLCGSALKLFGMDLFLDYITEALPSPKQKPAISGVNPKNNADETREPSEEAPFSALVFKTMADPFVGKLSLFRVFSGSISSDSQVYNSCKDTMEHIGKLMVIKGKNQESTDKISAGDFGAVAKLQSTTTNDTLCDKDRPIILQKIEFPKPVLTMAIEPKNKGDEDKISQSLSRLMEEDPTFSMEKDTVTRESIVKGLGELHLEVITSRLQKKFGVEVNLKTPKVPYKETIKSKAQAEGKHKKQSGGRGQYGHVFLELEYYPDSDFAFVDKIFGGAVPRQYIPAVEKGIRETLEEGVIAGYPIVNIRVTLTDGSYHSVDSSEMAFKIAASMAFKKGFMEAHPVLLEPIVNLNVFVPENYMGDIMGDLNKKRGRILGMERLGDKQVIKAQVPLSEIFKYAIDLRSITQGRGEYDYAFSHYEEVPAMLMDHIVAESKKMHAKE